MMRQSFSSYTFACDVLPPSALGPTADGLTPVHRCIPLTLNRDGAAALVGSLGLVPSINAGDDFVMGEPYVFPLTPSSLLCPPLGILHIDAM